MRTHDCYRPRSGAWPRSRAPLALAGVTLTGLFLVAARIPSGGWAGSLFPALFTEPVVRASPELSVQADAAAGTVRRAQDFVRQAKRDAGVTTDPQAAPDLSGLIGAEVTPLVTTLGSLEAKRIATNPVWAQALTLRLSNAGVRKGSVVAASLSGSFPGLNLATIAACQALEADLVAVSSITASSWGANQPGFTWPEIEGRLVRAHIIRQVSVAITAGGAGDRGRDLEPDGRALAEEILARASSELGVPAFRPNDLDTAVGQRFEAYQRAAQGRRLVLYVNVGGAEASLGRSPAILRLRSGLLPGLPFDWSPGRGLVARFAERGVPVLMLLNVRDLAVRWGVPLVARF
jgi:poly-gamma-glutamate system protein